MVGGGAPGDSLALPRGRGQSWDPLAGPNPAQQPRVGVGGLGIGGDVGAADWSSLWTDLSSCCISQYIITVQSLGNVTWV